MYTVHWIKTQSTHREAIDDFRRTSHLLSALAGEGGGCKPTPFQPITMMYKVAVYAPAEWADKLHLCI